MAGTGAGTVGWILVVVVVTSIVVRVVLMVVVVVIVVVVVDTGLVNLLLLLLICLFCSIFSNCLPILKLKGAKRFLLLRDNTFSVSNDGRAV